MSGVSWHHVQFVLAGALVASLVLGAVRTAAVSAYLRGLGRRDLLLLAGCLVLALAVRLFATTFVASTEGEAAQGRLIGGTHRWAAGWSAILHFLFLSFPGSVATIARLNVIISLATIVALFVLVDLYFEDRFAAFSAAAVLALQPISARYACSDSSAVLQTFCLVVGAAFLARWNGPGRRGLLLQGVGWLVLAANVRYESVVYLVAGAFVVIGGGGWPRPGRTRELLLGGLCGALFLLYPAGRALLDASGGVFELSPLGHVGVFVLSRYSPGVVVAVAFLGLLAATLARFRAAVWFLLALAVVSLPAYFFGKECADFGNRFALPHLALWAAFAGYGCAVARRLLRRAAQRLRGVERGPEAEAPRRIPPLAAAVVLALAVAAAVPHRGFLTRMWTHALEHDFIVSQLGAIPDSCLIVGPDSDRESRGLRISGYLSWEVDRNHHWVRADSPEVLAGTIAPCTIYYRSTTCHGYEAVLEPQNPDWEGPERPVCRRIGERFDLEPLVTTTIPSRGYTCEAHTVDPVPAGFYRMRPQAAGPGGGARR
ncbi:MAG: hypothetical protein HY906_26935 [Deltaproteobacteria bacterium]|nr:hypothetical protein [Deltaproteobacteria bacterium]